MREFFSVMIIFFCVSLYTPIWLSMFSYFEERRKRRKEGDTYRYFRMAFNVVVMLVSIFIPVFILLLVPKPSQEGNSLQKLVKVDLATQFIIQYIGGLLVSYLLIFFLISFLQRKLTAKKIQQIFLLDKYGYKIVNGFYGLVFSIFLFLYSNTDLEIVIFFKFMPFCFTASNFFYLICESNLKQFKSTNFDKDRPIMKYHE